jgi:uncharacterized protein YndB with AHSA1/START domain
MAPIVESIEIARPPEDVFAYVTDPSRLPEWQKSAVSARQEGEATTRVGTRVVVTRRLGKREIPMTAELTELDPPRTWALRGIDGPVRGIVKGTVDPLEGGERSRVTIELDFEGHGIGKLLLPLVVRRQVQAEMPGNLRTLKERLEAGA